MTRKRWGKDEVYVAAYLHEELLQERDELLAAARELARRFKAITGGDERALVAMEAAIARAERRAE